jgi:hypothetical protein
MKLWSFLFFLFLSKISMAQIMEVTWSDRFQKELHVSCNDHGDFCDSLCGAYSSCIIEEKSCRNCIGTGLQIHHILTELARSVRYQLEPVSKGTILQFIGEGNFATVSAKEVYNVIDGYGSLSVLKRFESLCSGETLYQLVFLELQERTRKVIGQKYVYCQYEDESIFLEFKHRPPRNHEQNWANSLGLGE